MAKLEHLVAGVSVSGLVPLERATVIAAQWFGDTTLDVTFRTDSGRTDSRILVREDEASLQVDERRQPWCFDADPALFKLAIEALRINLASLFDPLLAVHTSTVEPLPHQILAVYESMVQRHPLRFLLADDPGAGKTIMAGLLIKELMARGDVERCLVVAPGGLVEQWQDELDSKFQLPFEIATNDKLEAARTGNWFAENALTIARLDKLSRDEDLQEQLRLTHWDLVVVDEAHKMSANYFGNEIKYTKRYLLGQLLSEQCRHFLLMSATPHNGKDEDFQLFLSLLDGDRFENRSRDAAHTVDASDLMRRMVKEQLRRFDGTKLFPERRATTISFDLSPAEASLYASVTEYVREEFNRVEAAQDGRKGTVGFALTILQRRLASSPEAIYQSLRRRRERLESRLREAKLLKRGGGGSALLQKLRGRTLTEEEIANLDELEESTAEELEEAEDALVDQASAASTIEDLQVEIDILTQLEKQAEEVRRSGRDCKWEELSKLLQDQPEMFDSSGNRRKIIIFTEHRDTLAYLEQKIAMLLGKPESITTIHGSVGRDARRAAEEQFRHDPDVHILLATDAAGEGLNLQRAHLMVNYDLPWNPNRFEQRFGRIHRIGQTEVCHLWNLIAAETREGDVYQRLLDKVEAQRGALGRDAVFDILGELFRGTGLKDLLVEAIRYGERPDVKAKLFEAVDMATETDRVRSLIEKDALARDSMDARRIQKVREDMERAEAKRLQPFYVQAWFESAFEQLGGRMSRRERGRFEVTHVPAAVRSRDRQIGRGAPVLPRYERITFEKDLIRADGIQSGFVCPGHPLLSAVLDLTLERHRSLLRQGTVLVDPEDHGEQLKFLYVLDHSIRDGTTRSDGQPNVISRRLQFVLIEEDGQAVDAGHAPYVNWRPMTPDEQGRFATIADDRIEVDVEHQAMTFAASRLVPEHLREVRGDRDQMLDKTRNAVRQRLLREIQHWDHRANELKAREQAGKRTRLPAQEAARRADDLQARLQKRLDLIERQRHLAPASPIVTGGALVVPIGLLDALQDEPVHDEDSDLSAQRRAEIDRLAVQAVMQAERDLGREPRELEHHHVGYDIESRDQEGRLRFIEVKGKAKGKATITVSSSQIRTCLNSPKSWVLAVVVIDGQQTAEPAYLYGPFDTPPGFAEVGRNLKLADILDRALPPY